VRRKLLIDYGETELKYSAKRAFFATAEPDFFGSKTGATA